MGRAGSAGRPAPEGIGSGGAPGEPAWIAVLGAAGAGALVGGAIASQAGLKAALATSAGLYTVAALAARPFRRPSAESLHGKE